MSLVSLKNAVRSKSTVSSVMRVARRGLQQNKHGLGCKCCSCGGSSTAITFFAANQIRQFSTPTIGSRSTILGANASRILARFISTTTPNAAENSTKPNSDQTSSTESTTGAASNATFDANATFNNAQFQQQQETTHFGFQNVPVNEKQHLVGQVFANVANKYDVMNDFMSAGIHRLWKDEFVRMLAPQRGANFLDVAGGTGDISFRIIEALRSKPFPKYRAAGPGAAVEQMPTSSVTICDINPNMLEVGKQRAAERNYHVLGTQGINVNWLEGNAEDLNTIESDSMDAYTIAFGIRNVTHIDKALAEAYRVLKKGGRFMCLEFSQVHNPLLSYVYDTYSFNVIPLLGQLVANDRQSYQYLVESIRKFPNQETFKRMIEDAGFKYVSYTNMTFGVVAIHSGFKV